MFKSERYMYVLLERRSYIPGMYIWYIGTSAIKTEPEPFHTLTIIRTYNGVVFLI